MSTIKNLLLSDQPFHAEKALGIVRILVGIFMLIHGVEVFSATKMSEYATWEAFKKFPFPTLIAYIGKGLEFVAGILITLGWFTKLGSWILALSMLYIIFFVGNGKFWYEDQHPFLFVLLAVIFIFMGSGAWAVDKMKKL